VHPTTGAGPAPHTAFPPVHECLGPLHWVIKTSSPLFQLVPTLCFPLGRALLASAFPRCGRAGSSPVCGAPSPVRWVFLCGPGRFWEGGSWLPLLSGSLCVANAASGAGCAEQDPAPKQVFMLSALAYVGGRLQGLLTLVWDS